MPRPFKIATLAVVLASSLLLVFSGMTTAEPVEDGDGTVCCRLT